MTAGGRLANRGEPVGSVRRPGAELLPGPACEQHVVAIAKRKFRIAARVVVKPEKRRRPDQRSPGAEQRHDADTVQMVALGNRRSSNLAQGG